MSEKLIVGDSGEKASCWKVLLMIMRTSGQALVKPGCIVTARLLYAVFEKLMPGLLLIHQGLAFILLFIYYLLFMGTFCRSLLKSLFK